MKLASATWRIELICPSRSPPSLSMISSRVSRRRSLRSPQPTIIPSSTNPRNPRPEDALPAFVRRYPSRRRRHGIKAPGPSTPVQRGLDEVQPVVAPEHLVADEEGRRPEHPPLDRLRGRGPERLLYLRRRGGFEHFFGAR